MIRVRDLPILRVRVFRVKPVGQLPKKIGLREGITLSEAEKKTDIWEEGLARLGISASGIDRDKLTAALEKELPPFMSLRKGEKKTPENYASAIIGRLGSEEALIIDVSKALKYIRALHSRNAKGEMIYYLSQDKDPDAHIRRAHSMILKVFRGNEPHDRFSRIRVSSIFAELMLKEKGIDIKNNPLFVSARRVDEEELDSWGQGHGDFENWGYM